MQLVNRRLLPSLLLHAVLGQPRLASRFQHVTFLPLLGVTSRLLGDLLLDLLQGSLKLLPPLVEAAVDTGEKFQFGAHCRRLLETLSP